MMTQVSAVRRPLLLALLLYVVGCGGSGDAPSTADTALSKTNPGIVSGQVIDGATRKGVGGANIIIDTGETMLTAVTQTADADSATPAESGEFTITDVPAGKHRLRIEAGNYATAEIWVTIEPSTSPYYTHAGEDGKIPLRPGCSTDVYVTSEGTLLAGATVYATGPYLPEMSGVTDAAGKVSFTGLAQLTSYSFIAAPLDRGPDGTADGTFDYVGSGTWSYICTTEKRIVALDVPKAATTVSLAVIGGSFDRYQSLGGVGSHLVAPTEPLIVAFNYPVDIVGSFAMSYANSLVNDAGGGTAISVAANLSAGNTLLTLTPVQALPVNATVALSGIVSAHGAADPTLFTFGSSADSYGQWYVFDPTPLTDASSITIDNYNGQTEAAGIAATPYLEFPERVDGVATITQYTMNGVVTVLTTPLIVELGWGGAVVRDAPTGGCTSGACKGNALHYRVPLSKLPTLEDARTDAANDVSLTLDATDAEGSRITRTVTLAVE